MESPRYYANNETISFANSSRNGEFSPRNANKYSLTSGLSGTGPYDMVVLLQKGDKLKVDTSWVNTEASVTYTVLIYE